MPLLAICSRNDVRQTAKNTKAEVLIGLLQRNLTFAKSPRVAPENHLRIVMDDTHNRKDRDAPTRDQIDRIIAFYNDRRHLPAMVHCEAGVSTSTSTGLALLTMDGLTPADAAKKLDMLCLEPRPNLLVARIFDDALGHNGALFAVSALLRERHDQEHSSVYQSYAPRM